MTDDTKPATWRVVLAFILDLFTGFFVIGYIVALITGNTTENGFAMTGAPAAVVIGLLVAYFVLMPRFGGRLWQRILQAR